MDSFHWRRVVASLRMECLPLEVETGRYTQTTYEQRIYKLCKSAPERLLLICPALADIRSQQGLKAASKLSCYSNCREIILPPVSTSQLFWTLPHVSYIKRQSLFLRCWHDPNVGQCVLVFVVPSTVCLWSLSHGSLTWCHGKTFMCLCSLSLGTSRRVPKAFVFV